MHVHPSGQCELILRFINYLGLVALLLSALPCLAAEKADSDGPVDLTLVMPTENDWKTPVFGRGIDQLMMLTHLHYRVLAAPFSRGEVLMSQPQTCSGFASAEYARLNDTLRASDRSTDLFHHARRQCSGFGIDQSARPIARQCLIF